MKNITLAIAAAVLVLQLSPSPAAASLAALQDVQEAVASGDDAALRLLLEMNPELAILAPELVAAILSYLNTPPRGGLLGFLGVSSQEARAALELAAVEVQNSISIY